MKNKRDLLFVEVNSKAKAEKIARARKGFYEVFYGLDIGMIIKKIYTIYYCPI